MNAFEQTSRESKPPLRTKWLVVFLLVSLVGLGGAGLWFRSYAAVHLRPTAKMPRCVMLARRALMRAAAVSGSEPFPTPEGEVFLTPRQVSAMTCAQGISNDFAVKLAKALSEPSPEKSALLLLKILRDAPAGPEGDREATAAFILGQGALRSLPELPEVNAANDELAMLHACRFSTRRPCPSRPAPPFGIWLLGGPSAALFLASAFALCRRGVVHWLSRRREKKAKANAEQQQKAGAPSSEPLKAEETSEEKADSQRA